MATRIYTTIFLLFFATLCFSQSKDAPIYYKETFENGIGFWKTVQKNNYKWELTEKGPKNITIDGQKIPLGIIDPPLKTTDSKWMLLDALQGDFSAAPKIIDSKLFSPRFDCSNFKEVYLQFKTLFRRLDDNEKLSIGISTDSINFQYFPVFEVVLPETFCDGKTTFMKTQNPFVYSTRLESKYAFQPKVWIQFRYYCPHVGNYSWQLDDIELLNTDPTPICDLQIKDDSFAIAPYRVIPKSQLDSIPFMLDVINFSQSLKDNITARVDITDLSTNSVVFSTEKKIASIPTKQKFDNLFFNQKFLPPTKVGSYKGTYSIKSDCEDENLKNNSYSFYFDVSDNVFQKEAGKPTRKVSPYFDENATNLNWSYGNHFYCKNGENIRATKISFAIDNNPDLYNDQFNALLLEWNDLDNNAIAEKNEVTLVGKGTIFSDGDNNSKEFSVNLVSQDTSNKELKLKNNTNYLAVVEYVKGKQSEEGISMEMLVNDTLFYLPSVIASEKLSEYILYDSVLKIGDDEDYSTSGFDSPMTPLVRLWVKEEIVSSKDIVNDILNISVFPNPVQKEINIQVIDNQYSIIKCSMTNTLQQQMPIVFENNKINVEAFNRGVYFLTIYTNKGNFTKKIIKN